MPDHIHNVFKNFLGNWIVDHEKHSHEGELLSTAKGTAHFTRFNSSYTEMLFHEEGTGVYLSDKKEEIKNDYYRDYLYRLNNDNIMEIHHASGPYAGTPYQNYILNEQGDQLLPVATHECGIDFYTGIYDLIDKNNFILTTDIKGDGNKNGIIKMKFTRAPG